MENISNQISYLKGLMDGLSYDENSNEGKIFKGIMNVLDEINDTIDDLYDYQDEIAEQVDMLDEDLAAVEEELIDCDCDCDCDDCDCDCDDEFDEIDYYEVDCPNCGETVCLDEDFFDEDGEIVCPNCKQPIEIEFDCDCEECDCCEE